MRPLALSLLGLGVLPASGCCSIARAWCGPDKSAWISVDFRSPEAATRTLLEALRRDEPQVVYDALSDGLRTELGLDNLKLQVAWTRIKERYPYLHVAGYAAVPDATWSEDGERAAVVVEVEGAQLQIGLVRELHWELRYERGLPGENLPRAQRDAATSGRLERLSDAIQVAVDAESERDQSRVSLRPQIVPHEMQDELPIRRLRSFGAYESWKVRSLEQL